MKRIYEEIQETGTDPLNEIEKQTILKLLKVMTIEEDCNGTDSLAANYYDIIRQLENEEINSLEEISSLISDAITELVNEYTTEE
jgi:hypothetical protein